MSTFDALIEQYKAAKGLKTDIAVAEALGLGRTAFSNYKSGRRRLPDLAIAEIFDATGLDMTVVLAAANAHWDGTPDGDLPFWRSRLGPLEGHWRKR